MILEGFAESFGLGKGLMEEKFSRMSMNELDALHDLLLGRFSETGQFCKSILLTGILEFTDIRHTKAMEKETDLLRPQVGYAKQFKKAFGDLPLQILIILDNTCLTVFFDFGCKGFAYSFDILYPT